MNQIIKASLFVTALGLSMHVSAADPHPSTHPTDAKAAAGVSPNADNSKVNERDRNASQLTATDQSSGTQDTEITRQIRQAIVKDDSLSTYAQNIKIITVNGLVTLKGPVRTAEEKAKIESFAKGVAGVNKVDNMISIKK